MMRVVRVAVVLLVAVLAVALEIGLLSDKRLAPYFAGAFVVLAFAGFACLWTDGGKRWTPWSRP